MFKFMKRPSFITRNIMLLALISFFTDIASEMLYPVTPLYLYGIGFSVLAIGIIEGAAELVAGCLKFYAGTLSDHTRKRNIFIQIGYALSAVAKPTMGFMSSFATVFPLRFLDRAGKGIRTAPRDAILTDESSPSERGRVFGFHRGIDTLGATIGPIISFIFLFFYPSYQALFLFAFIPGILAIYFSFRLTKEKILETDTPPKPIVKFSHMKAFFKESNASYKKLFYGFTMFALLNGTNVFLLLRAKEMGISALYILGAYVCYNLVYALASYPVGVYADKYGYKYAYIAGIFVFAFVYGAFGMETLTPIIIVLLFSLYGISSAIEDGMGKAWLTLHIPQEHRAAGVGLYLFAVSGAFFVASVATGLSWQKFGGAFTFSMLSMLSLVCIAYFFLIKLEEKKS